ncbi:MAG: hypothetical protein M3O46_14125 [Myxococcota bacterium]|nr:hypothetical protein [Myxococcota bacterium]
MNGRALHSPYTIDPSTSFLAAQSCAALMLTALVLFWRSRSWAARGVMLFGVWLAAIANTIGPVQTALAYTPGPEATLHLLATAAACGTVAAILALRPVVAVAGAIGELALWLLCRYITDSEWELAALHLAWLGLLVGLLLRSDEPMPIPATHEPSEPSYLVRDALVFAIATTLAAIVCLVVMRRRDGSADEWAYTYQAAVFAKGHVYATSPRCQSYLQNFYVFESSGRLFSQYTPGWPLFMAPFVFTGVTWLSGPFSMGLMALGVARLGRSAVRGMANGGEQLSPGAIASAGTWSAVLATLGTTILINGASRYPHVYSIALYAWSLEALAMVSAPGLARTRQYRWGFTLGCVSAFILATRPADGALLGIGLAIAFLYASARGRVAWRSLATATIAFVACSSIVLIILRLQLGKWFATGYSLLPVIHPWAAIKYSMPAPNQWKYALPLASGAYCWWPCSLPFGLAGLAMLRGRSLVLATAMAIGCAAFIAYTEALDYGRGFDWGYGPRYMMPLIIPMAVGGGVALAPLAGASMRRTLAGRIALARGGPMALAAFAIVSGWTRIAPLVWPTVVDHTRRHAGLATAIADAHLNNAIVLAKPGTTGFDPLDLTTNLPIDLYPKQDVIIAIERSSDAAVCLRGAFPERKLFTASGTDPVQLAPL